MSREQQTRDIDWVVLKCGLRGAALIAVVGALIGWGGFVVADRLRLTRAARELQGGWSAGDGSGFWFDFSDGHRGTLQAWGTGVEFTERVRVVWSRDKEALLALGADRADEDYYLIRFAPDPDAIVMQGEGENTGTVLLVREKGPPSRQATAPK